MIAAVASLTALGLVLGVLLMLAGKFLKVETSPIIGEIEGMLPGTQCGQCGYPGCSPAAEAIANGDAPVTICPPGGKSLATAMAEKLGVDADLSDMEDKDPEIAFINEDLCIGCTKCLKKCPTDAIVGASRQIHVVINAACTGCEACVDICPTECITMKPDLVTLQTWHWPKPQLEDDYTRTREAENPPAEAA